jgi:hypothetical protein
VSDPQSGKTVAQLRGMSDDDLVGAHDAIASLSGSYSAADDYRAELATREVNRQTRVMLRLTWGR